MSFIERYPSVLGVIESSKVLSKGQKSILCVLVQCNQPLPSTALMEILGLSRQGLYFNIKKLLERGYIDREKETVYTYSVNESKILEIINIYEQTQKLKTSRQK